MGAKFSINRCGASLGVGGPQSNAYNPTLRLKKPSLKKIYHNVYFVTTSKLGWELKYVALSFKNSCNHLIRVY
jgi:hypothetical protein